MNSDYYHIEEENTCNEGCPEPSAPLIGPQNSPHLPPHLPYLPQSPHRTVPIYYLHSPIHKHSHKHSPSNSMPSQDSVIEIEEHHHHHYINHPRNPRNPRNIVDNDIDVFVIYFCAVIAFFMPVFGLVYIFLFRCCCNFSNFGLRKIKAFRYLLFSTFIGTIIDIITGIILKEENIKLN